MAAGTRAAVLRPCGRPRIAGRSRIHSCPPAGAMIATNSNVRRSTAHSYEDRVSTHEAPSPQWSRRKPRYRGPLHRCQRIAAGRCAAGADGAACWRRRCAWSGHSWTRRPGTADRTATAATHVHVAGRPNRQQGAGRIRARRLYRDLQRQGLERLAGAHRHRHARVPRRHSILPNMLKSHRPRRADRQKASNAEYLKHWSVVDGILIFDGVQAGQADAARGKGRAEPSDGEGIWRRRALRRLVHRSRRRQRCIPEERAADSDVDEPARLRRPLQQQGWREESAGRRRQAFLAAGTPSTSSSATAT